MGWRTVIVSQHAKLSMSMNNLVVQTADQTAKIPIGDIQVLLIGSLQVMISIAVEVALIETGATIIFTDKTGQPVGQTIDTHNHKASGQRILQQVGWSSERQETLWTHIIQAKISTQIQVLQYYDIDATIVENGLSMLELNDVTNREAVAARNYFTMLFGEKFGRRETSFAQNAGLNYGYAILLSAVTREIVENGYLTQLGIHHQSSKNPFNLGSDLLEPFRAIIDQWVAIQSFEELTPAIKWQLVDLLNINIQYNGKQQILRNAISIMVRDALAYLSEEKDTLQVEVVIPSEVSRHAFNDHV